MLINLFYVNSVLVVLCSSLAIEHSEPVTVYPQNHGIPNLEGPPRPQDLVVPKKLENVSIVNSTELSSDENVTTPRGKRALGVILQGLAEVLGYTPTPISVSSLPNPNTTLAGAAAAPPPIFTFQGIATPPPPPPAPPAPPPRPQKPSPPTRKPPPPPPPPKKPSPSPPMTPRQRETLRFTGVVNFGNNSDLLGHLQRYETIFHGTTTPKPPATPPPPGPAGPPRPGFGKPSLLPPFFVQIPFPIAPNLPPPLPPSAPRKTQNEYTYTKQENKENYERESGEIHDEKDVRTNPPQSESGQDTYIDEPRWKKKQRLEQEHQREQYQKDKDRENESSEERSEDIDEKNKYREKEIAEREREELKKKEEEDEEDEEDDEETREEDKKNYKEEEGEEEEDSREKGQKPAPEEYVEKSQEDAEDDSKGGRNESTGYESDDERPREPLSKKNNNEDVNLPELLTDLRTYKEPFDYLPGKVAPVSMPFGARLPIKVFDGPFGQSGGLRNSYGQSLEHEGRIDESVADYFQRYKDPETGLFDSRRVQTLDGKKNDDWWQQTQEGLPGLKIDPYDRIRQEYGPPANARYEEFSLDDEENEGRIAKQEIRKRQSGEEEVDDEETEVQLRSKKVEPEENIREVLGDGKENQEEVKKIPREQRSESREPEEEYRSVPVGQSEEEREPDEDYRKVSPSEQRNERREPEEQYRKVPVGQKNERRKPGEEYRKIIVDQKNERRESDEDYRKVSPSEKRNERREPEEQYRKIPVGQINERRKSEEEYRKIIVGRRNDRRKPDEDYRKVSPSEQSNEKREPEEDNRKFPVGQINEKRKSEEEYRKIIVGRRNDRRKPDKDYRKVSPSEQRTEKREPEEAYRKVIVGQRNERRKPEENYRKVPVRQGSRNREPEDDYRKVQVKQRNDRTKIDEDYRKFTLGQTNERRKANEEEPGETAEPTVTTYTRVRAPQIKSSIEVEGQQVEPTLTTYTKVKIPKERKEEETTEENKSREESVADEARQSTVEENEEEPKKAIPTLPTYTQLRLPEDGESKSSEEELEELEQQREESNESLEYEALAEIKNPTIDDHSVETMKQFTQKNENSRVNPELFKGFDFIKYSPYFKPLQLSYEPQKLQRTANKILSNHNFNEFGIIANMDVFKRAQEKAIFDDENHSSDELSRNNEVKLEQLTRRRLYDEELVHLMPYLKPIQYIYEPEKLQRSADKILLNHHPANEEKVSEERKNERIPEEDDESSENLRQSSSENERENSRENLREYSTESGEVENRSRNNSSERNDFKSEDSPENQTTYNPYLKPVQVAYKTDESKKTPGRILSSRKTKERKEEDNRSSNFGPEDQQKVNRSPDFRPDEQQELNHSPNFRQDDQQEVNRSSNFEPDHQQEVNRSPTFRTDDQEEVNHSPDYRPNERQEENRSPNFRLDDWQEVNGSSDFRSDDRQEVNRSPIFRPDYRQEVNRSPDFKRDDQQEPNHSPDFRQNDQEKVNHSPNFRTDDQEEVNHAPDFRSNDQQEVNCSPDIRSDDQQEVNHSPDFRPDDRPEVNRSPNFKSNIRQEVNRSPNFRPDYRQKVNRSFDFKRDDQQELNYSPDFRKNDHQEVNRSSKNYAKDNNSVKQEVGLPVRLQGRKLHEGERKEVEAWPAPFDYTFDSTETTKIVTPSDQNWSSKVDQDVEPTYETPAFLQLRSYARFSEVPPSYGTTVSEELEGSLKVTLPTEESPSIVESRSSGTPGYKSEANDHDIQRRYHQQSPSTSGEPEDQRSHHNYHGFIEASKVDDEDPMISLKIYEPQKPRGFSTEEKNLQEPTRPEVLKNHNREEEILRPQEIPKKFEDPQSAHEFFELSKDDYNLDGPKKGTKATEVVPEIDKSVMNREKELLGLLIVPQEDPNYQRDVVLTEFTEEPESETEKVKVNKYRNKVATIRVSEEKQLSPNGPVQLIGFTRNF